GCGGAARRYAGGWRRSRRGRRRGRRWRRSCSRAPAIASRRGRGSSAGGGAATARRRGGPRARALSWRRAGGAAVARGRRGAGRREVAARATRRQLLEYRCAFGVDGVLLVDAEARRVQPVEFALPRPPAPARALVGAFAAGVLVGAAVIAALALH